LRELYDTRGDARGNAGIVFPPLREGQQQRSFRSAWDHAVQRAGLKDFTFHSLRHSAASVLVQAGVPLYTVGQILGHKDPRMTARYSHLSQDHLREVLTEMTERIF
jgi:integrase